MDKETENYTNCVNQLIKFSIHLYNSFQKERFDMLKIAQIGPLFKISYQWDLLL